ncbi:MAG: 3-hydroxyacyl-CoA dehydrogenase NAD-binding domain-containing protein [Bacteriovoracia bacterium]
MNLQTLTFEIKNHIAYVGFGKYEKKSMTTLSRDAMEEMRRVLTEIQAKQKKEIKALIFFSHKPGVFLAGVDISLINSLKTEAEAARGAEHGQLLYNMIEDLKIPTAAVVDGVCLGGGLELSLACERIYASDNSKTALGLPEVMLGVLPGFGGTYRLPRKVGLPNALDMILTGRQVRGRAALKMGLVEAILPTERMLELVPALIMKPVPSKKSGLEKAFERVATENFLTRKIIFQKAHEKVMEQSKGFYPAPLKILEVLDAGAGKGRDAYLAMEAQAFGDLSQTVVSRNLQHIFFLTDNSKKIENKDQLPSIKRGGVLGAGVMGGGIAWLFANSDQAPLMKDISQPALELGLKQASGNFSSALRKRRMSEDEFNRKMRSITPTLTFDGFKGVDLVVEAVVENMDVKKKVFAELETKVRPDCLLTSNTSSLSVTEMAGALKDSSRFAGLHFFNPVNKMPLVEIIAHPGASQKTLQTLYKWALEVKKTPVIVNDGPGFLVNRILAPYLNEAAYLLEAGVSIQDIDQAALNFGMPMGPCRLMDEVGLDVCEKVGKIMEAGLGTRAKASALSTRLTQTGALGRKNNKGFFLYDEKGKVAGRNPEVEALLPTKSLSIDETLLQMRLFLPMINEAAYCLADKIIDKASVVDLGMIYGTGFPPFKGGLLMYADAEGLDRILSAMQQFASEVSQERYHPAPLLVELAQSKKRFYDL